MLTGFVSIIYSNVNRFIKTKNRIKSITGIFDYFPFMLSDYFIKKNVQPSYNMNHIKRKMFFYKRCEISNIEKEKRHRFFITNRLNILRGISINIKIQISFIFNNSLNLNITCNNFGLAGKPHIIGKLFLLS